MSPSRSDPVSAEVEADGEMADRTRDIDLKEHMVSSYIFQIFETILYLLLRFCPGWDIIQRQKIDPFTTSSMHAHFARHSA